MRKTLWLLSVLFAMVGGYLNGYATRKPDHFWAKGEYRWVPSMCSNDGKKWYGVGPDGMCVTVDNSRSVNPYDTDGSPPVTFPQYYITGDPPQPSQQVIPMQWCTDDNGKHYYATRLDGKCYTADNPWRER